MDSFSLRGEKVAAGRMRVKMNIRLGSGRFPERCERPLGAAPTIGWLLPLGKGITRPCTPWPSALLFRFCCSVAGYRLARRRSGRTFFLPLPMTGRSATPVRTAATGCARRHSIAWPVRGFYFAAPTRPTPSAPRRGRSS